MKLSYSCKILGVRRIIFFSQGDFKEFFKLYFLEIVNFVFVQCLFCFYLRRRKYFDYLVIYVKEINLQGLVFDYSLEKIYIGSKVKKKEK